MELGLLGLATNKWRLYSLQFLCCFFSAAGLSEEEKKEWFSKMDVDGSGVVDRDDLRAFMKERYEEANIKYDDAKIENDVEVRRFIQGPTSADCCELSVKK